MEPPSFLLDLFLWLLFWDQKQERKAQQQTSDQSTTTNSNLDTESHLASTNEQILAQYCNHNKFYHQLLSQIGKCALCDRMVSLWFAHHAGFENKRSTSTSSGNKNYIDISDTQPRCVLLPLSYSNYMWLLSSIYLCMTLTFLFLIRLNKAEIPRNITSKISTKLYNVKHSNKTQTQQWQWFISTGDNWIQRWKQGEGMDSFQIDKRFCINRSGGQRGCQSKENGRFLSRFWFQTQKKWSW